MKGSSRILFVVVRSGACGATECNSSHSSYDVILYGRGADSADNISWYFRFLCRFANAEGRKPHIA